MPPLQSVILTSKDAYNHLMQIAEKHGNTFFTKIAIADMIAHNGFMNDLFRDLILNAENVTNTLVKICKKHPEIARTWVLDHLRSMSSMLSGSFLKSIKMPALVDLTDEYPFLAQQFILKLPKNKKYLPLFPKLLKNLEIAIDQGDHLAILAMAILKFSGALSEHHHIKQDVEEAINLCLKVINSDNAKRTYTDPWTKIQIIKNEHSHKIAAELLTNFAKALWKGEALNIPDYNCSVKDISEDQSKAVFEKEKGPIGTPVQQENAIFAAEALLVCAARHLQFQPAIDQLNASDFQADLGKEYAQVLTEEKNDVIGFQKALPLLSPDDKALTILDIGEANHSFAITLKSQINNIDKNPFLANKVYEDFIKQEDWDMVFDLLHCVIFSAQQCLSQTQYNDIKGSLNDLLENACKNCFQLAMRYIGQNPDQNKEKIATLLSLMLEIQPNNQDASNFLKFGNLKRAAVKPIKNFELSKEKMLALIKPYLEKAIELGSTDAADYLSSLESKNGRPAKWNSTVTLWESEAKKATEEPVDLKSGQNLK